MFCSGNSWTEYFHSQLYSVSSESSTCVKSPGKPSSHLVRPTSVIRKSNAFLRINLHISWTNFVISSNFPRDRNFGWIRNFFNLSLDHFPWVIAETFHVIAVLNVERDNPPGKMIQGKCSKTFIAKAKKNSAFLPGIFIIFKLLFFRYLGLLQLCLGRMVQVPNLLFISFYVICCNMISTSSEQTTVRTNSDQTTSWKIFPLGFSNILTMSVIKMKTLEPLNQYNVWNSWFKNM